jgi:hypothetical protein
MKGGGRYHSSNCGGQGLCGVLGVKRGFKD